MRPPPRASARARSCCCPTAVEARGGVVAEADAAFDGLKVAKDAIFRVRMPAGRQRVRLSALGMGDGPVTAQFTAGTTEKIALTKQQPIAEIVVDGGKDLDVSLDNWGVVRWLTVTPEKP